MTRVLHLISDNSRRGAQVFASQLHERLRTDHGIDGALVALVDADGDDASVPAALAPSGRRERRRLLADYDLVVAHGSTTLDAAALHAPGRFIYRSIGDPRFWLDRPHRRLKTRLSLARAASVVALYPDAGDALQELAGVPNGRVTVIPNAVDVEVDDVVPLNRSVLDIPTGAVVVLYVGSLTWEKRVELIIAAAAESDSIHLVAVGAGALEDRIDVVGHERLGPRWHLTGAMNDLRPVYAMADVLTLASVTEGQPGAILEAAAFGVPTAAPAVGGVPDLLATVGGEVIDPASPADYAEALLRLSSPDTSPASAGPTMEVVAAAWAEAIRSAVG